MALTSCAKSGVLHVSFNQDCTCVAIGSQQGLHIYNVDTHKLCYRHAIGAVSIVEMRYCTGLVGFVGAGEQPALTPRKLTVLNTSASRVIQELSYPTSVLAVRMNRQRLVVVTAKRVHVYSLSNLACLRVIETEDNPRGCCALTASDDLNLLALPASVSTGAVRIYDLAQEGGNVLSEVQAHQTPVVALAWSSDGLLLATASAKGTLIRVHRMPSAVRSHSFRRGTMSATITSMAFSPQELLPLQLLVAASNHGTVHVFKLEEPEPPGGVQLRQTSAAAGILSALVRYSVRDMVEPARNIATIHLPQSVGTATCAFRRLAPQGLEPATTAGPVPAPAGIAGGADDQLLGQMAQPEARAAPGAAAPIAAAECCSVEAGGGGGWPVKMADLRVAILVATMEGLLYEYSLTDLLHPQGPKCNLDGEWSMLGSGSVLG